jgi:hypothetical protein
MRRASPIKWIRTPFFGETSSGCEEGAKPGIEGDSEMASRRLRGELDEVRGVGLAPTQKMPIQASAVAIPTTKTTVAR